MQSGFSTAMLFSVPDAGDTRLGMTALEKGVGSNSSIRIEPETLLMYQMNVPINAHKLSLGQ